MIGRTIGQYQIQEKLGEGGMGAVYKARDTKLNRTVAIKVLPPEKVGDPDRIARFVQEARAASALNNPNIITVHDIVSHAEGELIVMEYVEGRTLAETIAAGELRLPGIMKIAVQIADALAAAHAAGIVHRDLKPANVMVSRAGLVKVLDFGLAKLIAGPPKDDMRTLTTPRSSPGMVLGTVGYMSPEQVKGEALDRRSDIFNFGLILHEMLAGARAFQGETAIEVMSAILREPAPDLPETVPAPLRQIVSVCLEKDPASRFESARDIGFALRALQAGSSLSGALPKVEGEAKKGPWLVPVLSAAAVISAVTGLILLFAPKPKPFDLSAYKYTPVATNWSHELFGAWSPDGQSIAYSDTAPGTWQIMVRSLAASTPTQLTDLEDGAAYAFWSNDGNRIYFQSGGKLWSVGAAGGDPQEVISDRIISMGTLSPDGKTLAFWKRTVSEGKSTSTVWISSPPGAAPRKYEPAPFEVSASMAPNYLRFSRDGRKLGLSITTANGPQFWVLEWPDGPGAHPRRPFAEELFDKTPTFDWLPDSRHIVIAPGVGLWLGDTRKGTLERRTVSLVDGATEPAVSPDGKRILFTEYGIEYDIVEVPLDGSPIRYVLSTARQEYSPSWSKSGERMAYITNRAGSDEIWLRSAQGDWEKPVVTPDDFPEDRVFQLACAALSPDGQRIAFTRLSRTSGSKIWISPSTGGKPVLAVPPDPNVRSVENGISWSPESDAFAAMIQVDGVNKLAVVKVGSQAPPEFPAIPGGIGTSPAWSPDGRWIAFGGGTAQQGGQIVLVSPDGKNSRAFPSPVRVSAQAFVPVWSRDGKVLYIASVPGTGRLDAIDIASGKSNKISDLGDEIDFRSPRRFCLSGCLSPSGKSIMTNGVHEMYDLWILDGVPLPGRRK